MNIIGLSAYYHDSAACLIKNGDIISAAQEERFSRKKHDSSFPSNAINFCISQGKLELKDIDYKIYLVYNYLSDDFIVPNGDGRSELEALTEMFGDDDKVFFK